jgi:hypothetical protein
MSVFGLPVLHKAQAGELSKVEGFSEKVLSIKC